MRDGLHYGAPVGRKWRRAIREIATRSDFVSAGNLHISAALAADIKADLRPGLLSALLSELATEACRLFPRNDIATDRSPPQKLRGPLNDTEEALVSAARRKIRRGVDPSEIVSDALCDLLNERMTNRRRQIQAHIMKEAPRDVHGFRIRWSAAQASMDIARLAHQFLSGTERAVIQAREPGLDLNADLLSAR